MHKLTPGGGGGGLATHAQLAEQERGRGSGEGPHQARRKGLLEGLLLGAPRRLGEPGYGLMGSEPARYRLLSSTATASTTLSSVAVTIWPVWILREQVQVSEGS